MSSVKLGKYLHYKGKSYKVIGTAHHSETLEKLTVYQQLYSSEKFPKGTLWVRPLNMFQETVEINGQKLPRFKYIGK